MGRSIGKIAGSTASEAVLGPGTVVRGRISGSGALRVEGTVEGDVAIDGDLVVASGGSVSAEVRAGSVLVEGTVAGDIAAAGPVHVRAGASVSGNIAGTSVAIDEGSSIDGRIEAEFELPPELLAKPGR